MTTSATGLSTASHAVNVTITDDTLTVALDDGRVLSVPLAWFPRLLQGSRKERDSWRLIGNGQGVRWELLDEDISVVGLIAGQPSGESQRSFQQWLQSRKR
jgi:hypothetical protein